MINPVWLQTFRTLVEVGHFTKTAERLHMTQSGVSQHIQRLEDRLGVLLLAREGKRFSLTDAGEKLFREAATVLSSLENLEQSVKADSPFEGIVKVVSPGSVGLLLYPKLLSLQRKHPLLVAHHRFAPNVEVESALVNRTADLGIMTSPSHHPAVMSEPVATEALQLVTSVQHTSVTWHSLCDLGFINHPDGHHHAQLLLSANFREFTHIEQLPERGFSNQIGLILEPVRLGFGFTVLPRFAVEAFHHRVGVRTHTLPNPISESLFICRLRDRVPPKRVKTVESVIRETVGALQGSAE